jgi:hypothetical protein
MYDPNDSILYQKLTYLSNLPLARLVIYDRKNFIAQATGWELWQNKENGLFKFSPLFLSNCPIH